ncbi:MAG TPA: hypothetical protein VL096_09350 [Pirellulaceae bacterium]|nr:hypothetical protein [Pirellulaceae bacterium]
MFRLALSLAACAVLSSSLVAAEPPQVEKFLTEGKLADGQRELTNYLKLHPTDDEARFGLGTLQFVRSIEHLAQSLHQYGALGTKSTIARQLPILRLPVPENPDPEKIRYADVRRLMQNLVDDLAVADATLAGVKDARVKLPLHFALIRLDVNGDGRSDADETLWKMYASLNRAAGLPEEITDAQAAEFVIAFDRGDVHWLRGYCHLLSALSEYTLAHDWQTLFDTVAHQLFAKPDVPQLPHDALLRNEPWMSDIADAIAAIHLARFPVKEPKRCTAALEHLQVVIAESRLSWKAIQAETDDDHEWVPNPAQTGVIPGVQVTKEMIVGWHEFLDEADAILAGKKLVPHWRIRADRGINMNKVFREPREFDVVMWAHGAAALPYVEEGVCTTPETWARFQQIFRGNFIGFAIWFN